MLTFKSTKNGAMSDIPISVVESEIQRQYAPDKAKLLIAKFHDLILGSTITKVAGELAAYHHDAVAIFGQLKVPVKFIDVNGKDLVADGNSSGVYC